MVLRGGGEGSGYPGILEGSNREFEMTFRWNYLFSSVGTRHSSLGSRLSALGSRLSALSTRTMLLVMVYVQIFVSPSNCGIPVVLRPQTYAETATYSYRAKIVSHMKAGNSLRKVAAGTFAPHESNPVSLSDLRLKTWRLWFVGVSTRCFPLANRQCSPEDAGLCQPATGKRL